MKNRTYVLLIIAVLAILALSHFNMINGPTAMYMLGILLGWECGYSAHKDKMRRFFEELDCSCDDCDEECPNKNTEQ